MRYVTERFYVPGGGMVTQKLSVNTLSRGAFTMTTNTNNDASAFWIYLPIERTVKLSHGYTVTMTYGYLLGFDYEWEPEFPAFDDVQRAREFWQEYYQVRNAFCQSIADSRDLIVGVNDVDGFKAFEPQDREA